jgi:hypothetical protein
MLPYEPKTSGIQPPLSSEIPESRKQLGSEKRSFFRTPGRPCFSLKNRLLAVRNTRFEKESSNLFELNEQTKLHREPARKKIGDSH